MSDIDDYGRIDANIKRLERQLEPIRQRLLNDLHNGEHIGNVYVVSIVGKVQVRLDSKRLRNECPTVYEQYCKESAYREVSARKVTP